MRNGLIGSAALVALAMAAPAAAATRNYPLAGFTRVALEAAADVTIVTGDRFAVHADGSDALVAALAPVVQSDTLVLEWAGRAPHADRARLAIRVTLPRADGVAIRGAGHVTLDRAEGDTVAVAIEGTGTIDVAAIRAKRTEIVLRGTGAITVAGTSDWIDVRKTGVGSVDASGLTARGGVLTGTGVGNIEARVDGPVDVTLSGIGSIDVAGHPVCTIKRSGIGHVTCGG